MIPARNDVTMTTKVKKRPNSSPSSSNKQKQKFGRYYVPPGANLDAAGNVVLQKTHPHATRSRAASTTSQRSNISATVPQHSVAPTVPDPVKFAAGHPKPVFVNSGIVTLKNSLINVSFTEQPLLKMIDANRTQVRCASGVDKTKLIEKLKALEFHYFTFTESESKPILFVLKGHHRVTCDELKQELDEIAVPATRVTFLWDQPERPLYIIHFERGKANLHALNNTAKAVGNVIVSWERFNRAQKRLTQCHNCQLYGHSATNCGHKYRCIKCLNTHLPGQCLRKTKDDAGTPKCVNCQGEHAANSQLCQHFITYSAMVQRQRLNRTAASRSAVSNHRGYPAQQASPAAAEASLSRENFPDLPLTRPQSNNQNQNVNRNLNGSNSNAPSFAKISSLQARLAAVADINEAILKFEALVVELESAHTVEQKVQILFHHCSPNNGN